MRAIKFLMMMVVVAFASTANAQVISSPDAVVPEGAIVYSLPSTTISLKVTAEHESFVAGPYAAYAQKYLGIKARQNSGSTYTIKQVELVPYIEADEELSAVVNLSTSRSASANFLNLCAQGLIITSDSYIGKPVNWRFASQAGAESFITASGENLTNKSTTLYKTVSRAGGLEKVPVQQSQVVQMSPEQKAAQTAELIFKLRQKKVDIITGDTDATFDGQAMQSVIDEINRLEEAYLSMFLGTSVIDEQTVVFDVIPTASNANQMYIAFRLSDKDGLLPSANVQGRPFVLELQIPQGKSVSKVNLDEVALATKGRVAYRKPLTVIAKLKDGSKEIMQARIPVYQLGKIMSFPIETALGK